MYTVPDDCERIIVVTTSSSDTRNELGCGAIYSGRKEEYAVSYNKYHLDGQYRVNIAIFENPKKGDTISTVAAGWGTVSIFMQ